MTNKDKKRLKMLYGEEVVHIIKECRKVGDIVTDKIILRAYKTWREAQREADTMTFRNPENTYRVLGMEVV